ncbi:MAG: DUF885 domain-containing protein [Oscillospiraceae bacterium]|jgi:uncharacterized protein (DUF885 family)|nr:DUF885 domain-containing protein [Oscillospiraceae bacterium]
MDLSKQSKENKEKLTNDIKLIKYPEKHCSKGCVATNKIKNTFIIIITLLLCLSLLSGCLSVLDSIRDIINGDDTDHRPEYTRHPDENGMRSDIWFDIRLDILFERWVTSDSITTNFILANPGDIGVTKPKPTFGNVINIDTIKQDKEETTEIGKILSGVIYNELRDDQKVIYDILERSYRLSYFLESEDDFFYYSGYIRPLTGLQVELPILLSEFKFHVKEDIEIYLKLLEDTIRYFDEIIEFEKERARRGFFLSNANIDIVIEQLVSYLSNREDNFVIQIFNDRIDEYEGLTSDEKVNLKERHKELILENVLIAFDNLLAAMYEIKNMNTREGGLSLLPNGEAYAYTVLRARAGTDKSIKEIDELLEKQRADALARVRRALRTNEALLNKYMSDTTGEIADGTPEEYIRKLQEKMAVDFPTILPVEHIVLEVHPSLQDFMSPAFFLKPPIDDFSSNVIYINPASLSGNFTLFTALAHESYPGHLYQMVYMRQQNKHPIHAFLANMGYTEGWAMYAEEFSYYYSGLDRYEAEFMWDLRMYFLLLESHADFGVNVLGWSIDDIARILRYELEVTDTEVVEDIYNRVTGVPLNTVVYSLGYYEMLELRDIAADSLASNFDLMEFNRFILDIGPAPYQIISSHMDIWLESSIYQRAS